MNGVGQKGPDLRAHEENRQNQQSFNHPPLNIGEELIASFSALSMNPTGLMSSSARTHFPPQERSALQEETDHLFKVRVGNTVISFQADKDFNYDSFKGVLQENVNLGRVDVKDMENAVKRLIHSYPDKTEELRREWAQEFNKRFEEVDLEKAYPFAQLLLFTYYEREVPIPLLLLVSYCEIRFGREDENRYASERFNQALAIYKNRKETMTVETYLVAARLKWDSGRFLEAKACLDQAKEMFEQEKPNKQYFAGFYPSKLMAQDIRADEDTIKIDLEEYGPENKEEEKPDPFNLHYFWSLSKNNKAKL